MNVPAAPSSRADPAAAPPSISATPFGLALFEHRRNQGLSQARLARAAGVSTRHLCFLERGRAAPSRAMALRLADALGLEAAPRAGLLLAAGFAPVGAEGAWLTQQGAAELIDAISAIRAFGHLQVP